MIRVISGVPVHDCGCGLKAYRREVVEGRFVPKGFMNRFSPVSLGVKGHEFSEVEIVDRPRIAGESHYGLSRVFIVFRDVCVLPFAVRNAAVWRGRFWIIFFLCAGGALISVLSAQWICAALLILLALFSFSNATNLARFVKAQVEPPFRVKEYR
jgi:hypothetical protein